MHIRVGCVAALPRLRRMRADLGDSGQRRQG
jgi:hypothetical protein